MNLCLSESTNRHRDHIERISSVNSSLLRKMANSVTLPKKRSSGTVEWYGSDCPDSMDTSVFPTFFFGRPETLAVGGLYRLGCSYRKSESLRREYYVGPTIEFDPRNSPNR